MIVLDASLIGPLVIPDEAADLSAESAARLVGTSAIVPSHWRLEVANMMRSAERRGRLSSGLRTRIFEWLVQLPIEIDRLTSDQAWTATAALSDRHGLTSYDAAYLELAKRRGAVLATRPAALIRAAADEMVMVERFSG